MLYSLWDWAQESLREQKSIESTDQETSWAHVLCAPCGKFTLLLVRLATSRPLARLLVADIVLLLLLPAFLHPLHIEVHNPCQAYSWQVQISELYCGRPACHQGLFYWKLYCHKTLQLQSYNADEDSIDKYIYLCRWHRYVEKGHCVCRQYQAQ